jgi:L-cysteine:1D-myo-inositol 2-amino-2-deoxy-alpha-D-glucopyranoside ligase
MAIRLAILAHHYRSEWEWTDQVLEQAQARLARWRSAIAATGPAAEAVLAEVRERLADDLDAPGALAAIDRWADRALSGKTAPSSSEAQAGDGSEGGDQIRAITDALLGVAL